MVILYKNIQKLKSLALRERRRPSPPSPQSSSPPLDQTLPPGSRYVWRQRPCDDSQASHRIQLERWLASWSSSTATQGPLPSQRRCARFASTHDSGTVIVACSISERDAPCQKQNGTFRGAPWCVSGRHASYTRRR